MKQQSKICAYCGEEFIPERRCNVLCTPTCRQYSYIKRKTGEAPHDKIKQKEVVNLELQSVPALVLEEAVEVVPIQNHAQNQEASNDSTAGR